MLSTSDLHLDAVYLGGSQKDVRDDPLDPLIPGVGNQGGFRYIGSPWKRTVRLALLYTSGTEVDWPDSLDPQTGRFTYYGDNRRPGRELHNTARGGNKLLRDAFDAAHGALKADRLKVPPFLLFEKAAPGRAVRFRGLLAPGGPTLAPEDGLTAIWRSKDGLRFQNYRALFTVLDVAVVSRSWLDAVRAGGSSLSEGCPESWRRWVEGGVYQALVAPATVVVRNRQQQLPDSKDKVGERMLAAIRDHFQARPTDFEECAVEIWRMISPGTGNCYLTPPKRDGGRDALGEYPIGPIADRIKLDFALEAKCYGQNNSVGVREVSRLIARLRPRNFGVFVTTSFFASQAYGEIRSDEHPIALVSGRDIVEILRVKGYGGVSEVQTWLKARFPA
ncbi:MAG: restriction endonuclease [Actinomycetia bacterium]|nr:restriction endonuclease [Actinomycetes bacterium]